MNFHTHSCYPHGLYPGSTHFKTLYEAYDASKKDESIYKISANENTGYTEYTARDTIYNFIPIRKYQRKHPNSETKISSLCPEYDNANKYDIFWIKQREIPSDDILEFSDDITAQYIEAVYSDKSFEKYVKNIQD